MVNTSSHRSNLRGIWGLCQAQSPNRALEIEGSAAQSRPVDASTSGNMLALQDIKIGYHWNMIQNVYDMMIRLLNCDTNTAWSTSSKNIIKISKDIKGMLHKDGKNMQLSVTMSIDVSIFCSICWCWPWSEQLPILKIYSTLPLFGARVDRRANRIGTYRHQDFSSTRTQQSGIFHFVSHMFASFQIFQVLFPIRGWEKDSGRKSISRQGFSAGGFR